MSAGSIPPVVNRRGREARFRPSSTAVGVRLWNDVTQTSVQALIAQGGPAVRIVAELTAIDGVVTFGAGL
jgi:hypothetical protein